jgi:hypothetical protein
MSSFTLLSIAVIAPAVLALPVPQYGWPGQGSFPVGTATMGGLTSSITTGDGGFSSAGPPRPNCREWQDGCQGYNYPSNNNGGGWGWKGNGGNNNGWPSNSYDNNNNYNGGWNNGYQGGETSTIVTTSGPGGITASSQSYDKVKRHEPEPKSEGYGSWLSGLFGNYGYGKPRDAPVGTATMGGLTSSITLGDHKKRQIEEGVSANGIDDSSDQSQAPDPSTYQGDS